MSTSHPIQNNAFQIHSFKRTFHCVLFFSHFQNVGSNDWCGSVNCSIASSSMIYGMIKNVSWETDVATISGAIFIAFLLF